jgi:alkanesulfonate monooxygenase SsuD/methylene tetrahydromethanopterin reductase-like flavin-dependent oxidoreductase (luciferase family)
MAGDRIEAYDVGWTFDHLDPIFSDRDGSEYEGWTMLAALSAVVQRIRLGVMVTGNTYRHPAVLANMAATLDVASGGRLEIGLGTGWTSHVVQPPVKQPNPGLVQSIANERTHHCPRGR